MCVCVCEAPIHNWRIHNDNNNSKNNNWQCKQQQQMATMERATPGIQCRKNEKLGRAEHEWKRAERERKADKSCAQKGYGVQHRMRDRASSIMRSIIRELLIPLSKVMISNV